jgi:hypothetical protein
MGDEPKKPKKSTKFDDDDSYMGDEDKDNKIDKIHTKERSSNAKKETRGRPKSNQVDKDESLNIKNTKEGSKRKRAETDNNMDDDYNDDY